jgi:hypothetical protein
VPVAVSTGYDCPVKLRQDGNWIVDAGWEFAGLATRDVRLAHNRDVATWDDVARIVDELPLVEEPLPHDWRVGKKLVAWERPLRGSDRAALAAAGSQVPTGDILGVRVADEGAKFALVADEPKVYFTTPHFDGYPAVLVRLDEIPIADLRELITEAWLVQAPRQMVKEFLRSAE